VPRALEVGAGTGKATRVFAARGIEVTALEPDADMAKVLARVTLGLPLRPVVTTFEHFRTESHFDLVYAAASWHWTSPGTRWAQAVKLLVPGGVLALFGAPAELKDPDLFAAGDQIEKGVLPEDDSVDRYPWSTEEMAAAEGLAEIAQHDLPRVATTTAEDFVGRRPPSRPTSSWPPSSVSICCVRSAPCCQTISTSTQRYTYLWFDGLITR
jgi:SAM-dependent methyltransferase